MFTAAGKTYESEKQLKHRKLGEYQGYMTYIPNPIYEDIYGRKVVHIAERFPCFDSYDSLYENRYYNWYFIKYGEKVAVVYIEDECDEINVCDDIEQDDDNGCQLLPDHIDEMKICGFLP